MCTFWEPTCKTARKETGTPAVFLPRSHLWEGCQYPSVKVLLEVLPKFFKPQDSPDAAWKAVPMAKRPVSTPTLLYNWHGCDNEAVFPDSRSIEAHQHLTDRCWQWYREAGVIHLCLAILVVCCNQIVSLSKITAVTILAGTSVCVCVCVCVWGGGVI